MRILGLRRFGPFLSIASITVSAVLVSGTAGAQSDRPATASDSDRDQPESPPARGSGTRWEIEAHGGVSATSAEHGGTGRLPDTGAIIGGLIGVSTFYLGDGAILFNQNQLANTARPGGPLIVPLDPILIGPAI